MTSSLRLDDQLDHEVPGEIGEHMLNALREALSNAARHGQARHVDIGVTVGSDLVLVVSDNGSGIKDTSRRSGLANLAERAQHYGGALTVGPASGGGTELRWQVPLPRPRPRQPDRGPAQPPGSVAGLSGLAGAGGNALVIEYPGRVGGGLSPALHAQLGEQRRHIVLDRLLGEEHALADLPVGQALADQLQDLLFLLGEPGQRVGARRPGRASASSPGWPPPGPAWTRPEATVRTAPTRSVPRICLST